ncbi:hypothetical protein [uncultured Tateyamaria sp.]|uniref:hypothetical protein n=1 Tax=uncultured Tateyamaria sp. TaxID=455651 RepID=UPI0026148DC0|nr:hypothetical protein [uncultured Tateyamaria sp.]
MIRFAAAVALSAVAAHADTYCADLTALSNGTITEIALPSGKAGICAISQDLSGARAVNCRWPFDYRVQAATDAFTRLLDATAQCLNTEGVSDQGVNHPDSYDLRTFDTDTGQVSVSIKDKGALQQTFIFLRVAPPA